MTIFCTHKSSVFEAADVQKCRVCKMNALSSIIQYFMLNWNELIVYTYEKEIEEYSLKRFCGMGDFTTMKKYEKSGMLEELCISRGG